MVGAAGGFSEEQFREACAELDHLSWELLEEDLDLRFYRLRDQETGLYTYKYFGVLKDCPPALLADVYMDIDYRKEWDQNVKEFYEEEYNGQTVVYQQVKNPFLMPNRDYVYIRERRELDVEGRKIYVVLAQSTSHPEFPERSGVIRVKQYKESLALTSDGGNGSKVFMYYFNNLGPRIPTWLINKAFKKGIPTFVKELAKACRNYPGRT
ncbi:phosphatidylcholine transfer protein-like [Diceros bicornis minor]|uniref:phosphatidylcholine transfer protein-like n=1 Tax=Diceros bicornis minor TaxID=77932 RepID=UPI0026EED609|nr:phosphatidylcholine transfer protein-like [Diceros bicornis minor]